MTAEQLLDPAYLAARARLIDPHKAQDFGAGNPVKGGTIYLTAADENAGAEGRVQLVARERYVVDAAFLQVDATVGSQLSSVDEDTCAATVSDVSQTCNRQDLTGHVGGPGDCEQRGRLGAQFTDQTLDLQFEFGAQPVVIVVPAHIDLELVLGQNAAKVDAGPVGLTAALCLARAGHEVRVFEKRPELNAASRA